MATTNEWDGTTPLTTTHRTDEHEIIRKCARMIVRHERLPKWVRRSGGWTPYASAFWNRAAARICRQHGITNSLVFLWFVDRAHEYRSASRVALHRERLKRTSGASNPD